MEEINYLKIFAAFFFVIAIIGIFAGVAKKLELFKQKITLSSKNRLKIIETLYITRDHKLFLFSKDKEEYLIFSANGSNILISQSSTKKASENV